DLQALLQRHLPGPRRAGAAGHGGHGIALRKLGIGDVKSGVGLAPLDDELPRVRVVAHAWKRSGRLRRRHHGVERHTKAPAASPTPDAPAWMSRPSPAARPPSTTRLTKAVRNASGMPAAATRSSAGGAGNTWPRGAATYSACPPPASSAHTRSSEPGSVPATSSPRISGSPGGGG